MQQMDTLPAVVVAVVVGICRGVPLAVAVAQAVAQAAGLLIPADTRRPVAAEVVWGALEAMGAVVRPRNILVVVGAAGCYLELVHRAFLGWGMRTASAGMEEAQAVLVERLAQRMAVRYPMHAQAVAAADGERRAELGGDQEPGFRGIQALVVVPMALAATLICLLVLVLYHRLVLLEVKLSPPTGML
jgi:hypothetical protein